MKETDIWAKVKVLGWDFAEREEPSGCNAGLPDMLLVTKRGGDQILFVENKIAILDRDLFGDGAFICRSPGLRPSQVRWHTMFQKASRNSYFLIGVKPDQVYALSGFYARELKREEPLLRRASLVKRWTLDGLIESFDEASSHAG